MPGGAVLCVACGYNYETGRTVKYASARRAALGGAARRLAKGAGTFMFGCLLSAVGAGLGAVIWIIVVRFTGYEVGWIALGLGGLAGLGMRLGYGVENTRAGLTASSIAIGGIVGAKLLAFVWVILTVVTGATSDIALQREYVKIKLAEDMIEEQGFLSDKEREEHWESVYTTADMDVSRMSDEQVRDRWQSLREEDEREFAYLSDTGAKRARLASHRAERRADGSGLALDDVAREELYEEEFRRCGGLSEAELDTAIAELDTWEEKGRWSDEAYIRDHLIYQKAIDRNLKVQQSRSGSHDGEIGAEQWETNYNAARAEVDAMTPQERLDLARQIEIDAALQAKRHRLAWHAAEQRAMAMGLSYSDGRRNELYEEESAKFANLTEDSLEAEVAALDAWEGGGKWSDADYVRNRLIYQHIDTAIEERRDVANDESDAYWDPSPDEWGELYREAVAHADTLPPGDRAARAKELESERRKRWERVAAETRSSQAKEARRDFLSLFAAASFGPMDCLFFLLAVVTAFKVAGGASEQW